MKTPKPITPADWKQLRDRNKITTSAICSAIASGLPGDHSGTAHAMKIAKATLAKEVGK